MENTNKSANWPWYEIGFDDAFYGINKDELEKRSEQTPGYKEGYAEGLIARKEYLLTQLIKNETVQGPE